MKTYRLLIFAGLALLLAAVVIFLWHAAPLISSRLYTRSIPTAPVLSTSAAGAAPDVPVDAGMIALLPFESTGIVPETETATPIPEATPMPTSTATQLPTPTSNPARTATPTPTPFIGSIPTSLKISSLNLEAPVVPIGLKSVIVNGTSAMMWDVPNFRAAGWHETSARLGVPGNTVLNGHNTANGEVFRDLYRVTEGALVLVTSQEGEEFAFRVKEKYILPEARQPLQVRLQNARYVQETADERLTMVTCHPYGSLANRLIVIAFPVSSNSKQVE